MSSKRTPKKTKKSKRTSTKNNQPDQRIRAIFALLSLFLVLFMVFAFTSYFFTWKEDQSKLDLPLKQIVFQSDIQVENWAGKAGAGISNIFIHKWFGLGSFGILFMLLALSLNLFNYKILPLGKTFKYGLLYSLWMSVSLGFLFSSKAFFLGGQHGIHISNWLVSIIGKTGTFLLLAISFIIFTLLCFKNSLYWFKSLFKSKEYDDTFDDSEEEEEKEANADFLDDDFTITDVSQKTSAKEDEIIEEVNQNTISTRIDENENIEVVFDPDKNGEEGDDEKENNDPELSIEDTRLKNNGLSENIVQQRDYDPTLDLSDYQFPPLSLLKDHSAKSVKVSDEELISNKNKIVETLANYKIKIDKIKATIGPTITLYEIIPAPGVRISKIKNLEDDIALSLSALGIRIIAPIPGRGTIGIEVPNRKPEVVSMYSILASRKFQDTDNELPIALGKTISNETFTFDLTKMPHLLVAGATGQGKSVGLNAIISSLLYKKHPSELKFVLVDPKKVELTLYNKLERHFLATLPDCEEAIITETQMVINTLNSLGQEMDSRYDLLKAAQVRNIKEYNNKFIARRLNPEKGHRYLPYVVVIIDEFADLIMTAGKEVELPLTRIAQLARAVGIHMVIATQRPSTNIITGIIKANFPARIAFKVASMIDSRTILDSPGANHLVGRGDMLISIGSDMERLQCAFIDTPEVESLCEYIGSQRAYPSAWLLPEVHDDSSIAGTDTDLSKRDDLFEEAARLLVSSQQGSTSSIQRKFSIGYNRAGRIMDQLEAAGIVGPFEGSKARQVLYQDLYSLEQFLNNMEN